MQRTVWTLGHSTRTAEEFLTLLRGAEITHVADVRRFPGSRRYPQFNREALRKNLNEQGIDYVSLPELGGRREARKDSVNTGWRNASFRGYADYMETEEFERGVDRMMSTPAERIAMMCSEAVWWECHRSLIADYLKARGICVIHILAATKHEEHPFTRVAKIIDGRLSYGVG